MFYGWTVKTAGYRNLNLRNSLLHPLFGLEDTIQKPGDYLFWFSFGGYIMDQRSRGGRVQWTKLKSSRSIAGKKFPNLEMLDAKIASVFKQDHPELPLQEEGQSRGTESPESGPVSTRKTDRLHYLRLSRCRSRLRWFIFHHSSGR